MDYQKHPCPRCKFRANLYPRISIATNNSLGQSSQLHSSPVLQPSLLATAGGRGKNELRLTTLCNTNTLTFVILKPSSSRLQYFRGVQVFLLQRSIQILRQLGNQLFQASILRFEVRTRGDVRRLFAPEVREKVGLILGMAILVGRPNHPGVVGALVRGNGESNSSSVSLEVQFLGSNLVDQRILSRIVGGAISGEQFGGSKD